MSRLVTRRSRRRIEHGEDAPEEEDGFARDVSSVNVAATDPGVKGLSQREVPQTRQAELMPPVSKRQAAYMRAVAGGKTKKKGLSKTKAKEYVSGYPTKKLPNKKRGR